jgi:hypothetical protein
MATPVQLQAQAAQLQIQIALLTQQLQSANTPASERASLIVQRSQLQNDLVIVQQETAALTQESNPPDPTVPTPPPAQQVQSPDPTAAQNPFAAQAALQNQQVAAATPVTDPTAAQNPFAAQAALQNQQVQAATPAPVVREEAIAAANEQAGLVTAPEPGTVETFRPGESTITAVTKEPAPDTYEAGGGGGNQGTITRVTYQPADVPPTEDPAAGEAVANEQQSTITGARGGNIDENESIAAANQAAIEERARQQQAIRDQFQSPANGDWRVKLKLGPDATYLYKDGDQKSILAPLAASDGVIFPYMPDIQTTYNANYDTTDLTHSNYRGYFYKSSYVGDINITGVFTAQNTAEANYLLAVIHFFRSATKMFYGQDDSFRGAPPPLVYLFGLGQYQFNAHPCVIRSFSYNLPNDVDYIRTKPNNYNVNFNNSLPKTQSGNNPISAVFNRLRNALLPKGAIPNVPQELLTVSQSVSGIDNSTYVPTKITVQISLLPIQTRSQQSQQFSVKGFANGTLLKGGFW